MDCSKCGKENAPGAKFCRDCGEKLTGDQGKICSQCGAVGSATAKFCKACGAPFASSAMSPPAATETDEQRKPEGNNQLAQGAAALPLEESAQTSQKTARQRKPKAEATSKAAASAQAKPVDASQPKGKASDQSGKKASDRAGKAASVRSKTAEKPTVSPGGEAAVLAEQGTRRSAKKATAEQAVSRSRAGEPRHSKGRLGGFVKGVLALGVAAVLLVQCVPGILPQPPQGSTSAGQGETKPKPYSENPFPGLAFSEAELATAGETVTVSPEEPRAAAAGVTVDFGEYNLSSEASLEIARLPVKVEPIAGVEVTAYNITLDGMEPADEFTTMVDITLPYDPSGISESNEVTAFSAGWYDAAGNWIILPSIIDTEANTISFKTSHFSVKAVLKNTQNQGASLFYYEGGRYAGPTTRVLVDTGALISELRKIESDAFEKLIRDRSVPTNEMLSTGLGLTNIVTSGVDYSGSLFNTMQETLLPALSPVASSLKNKLLGVGIAATSVKVIDQYSRGVDTYKIFRDNILDAMEILVSGAAVVYGSPFLVMVGAGIWAVGVYDQATYDPEDITSYLDRLEEVYDQFTRRQAVYNIRTGEARYIATVPGQTTRKSADEIILSSKAAWALAVKSIYLQSKGEPQKIQERVDMLVRSVSGLFWTLYRRDPGTLYHWIDEESGLLAASAIAQKDLPWPGPEAAKGYIEKMIEREVIRTHDLLQDIYDEMSEFEIAELRLKYLESVMDLAEEYNQTMAFELVDETLKEPGFAKSPLADKTFVFDVPASLAADFKITARPTDTNQVFTCSVYHYMLAGMPTQLHMYPFDGDFAVRDEEFTFDPKLPVTKISLQGVPQVEVGILEIDGPKVRSYEGHNSEMGGVKVNFDIYYRDGFPEGSKITHEFNAGDGKYSSDPQYGEKLPDGRWLMRIDYDYLVDGTYQPVFQMIDAQGNVLGEDSITINISGLWDGTYVVNPAVPLGDPDAPSDKD